MAAANRADALAADVAEDVAEADADAVRASAVRVSVSNFSTRLF